MGRNKWALKKLRSRFFPGTFAYENNPKSEQMLSTKAKHTEYRKDSTVFSGKKKKKVYCIWKSIDIFYKKG